VKRDFAFFQKVRGKFSKLERVFSRDSITGGKSCNTVGHTRFPSLFCVTWYAVLALVTTY
jgi:hypothetical protein